jgi:hypothetical protein
MAGYSGYLIWRVFLGVDSYEFPARNYGDLGFRTWGTTARYVTNICQALGLLLLLGQVTIQYGENISQVSRFRLCYAVCPELFVCTGFFFYADPDPQSIRMGGKLCSVAEPISYFHNNGCHGTFTPKL